MFSKTKIALAAALVLGAASAALANDIETNPTEAQAMREMRGNPLPWWWNTPAQGRGSLANAGSAFGSVASSAQQDGPAHNKLHNR
jgi:hypothetical protein